MGKPVVKVIKVAKTRAKDKQKLGKLSLKKNASGVPRGKSESYLSLPPPFVCSRRLPSEFIKSFKYNVFHLKSHFYFIVLTENA